MALRSLILSSLLFVASVAAADHKIFDSHSKHQRRQNNQPWLQCNPGQYYDSNLAACTSCPAGSYNREPRQTSCRLARAGYYVPNSGATDETPCQAGTYTSTQGRTSCDLCPPGAKCPNSALAQPQLCSPGTYNSQSGQRDCASCQPGYFNSVQGATGCCACCAGWLNENPRLTNCRLCPNQTPYSSPGCGSTGCCSKTMGMYAPVSQCNQSGRNCPITFTTGPSNVVRRSYIKSHTCSQLGFKACPVYKRHGLQLTVSGYDCVDVYNDLEYGLFVFFLFDAPDSVWPSDHAAAAQIQLVMGAGVTMAAVTVVRFQTSQPCSAIRDVVLSDPVKLDILRLVTARLASVKWSMGICPPLVKNATFGLVQNTKSQLPPLDPISRESYNRAAITVYPYPYIITTFHRPNHPF
ncbi:hypothetical protein HGRIS_000018 [Hohenbuehelia grisea]|uniref:Tyrosine-protein kinase ephrin type A/B receptor-like domain-containing protein n=1 Tax=Hohenbuehelia grisea TaxID=104357 RepID=A0ABR3JQS6_9AGAR